jgi:hypothetical protein
MSSLRTEFSRELSEAIAWARKQEYVNWKHNHFRSSALHSFSSLDDFVRPEKCSLERLRPVVSEVVECRRNLISVAGSVTDAALMSGRLLRHDLAETTCTAEPHAITGGYFDEYDVPAWDTWLGLVDDAEHPMGGYLVAWVPDELVVDVDSAIKQSFEENICWVD